MTDIPEWKKRYNAIVKARVNKTIKLNSREKNDKGNSNRRDGKDVLMGKVICDMCGAKVHPTKIIKNISARYCKKCAEFKGMAV